MLDDALENGWDNNIGGFYDEGYYFKGKNGITITADTKNWWAQAEGLNTLLLMAGRYPDDKHQYFEKFKTLWKYVQTYLIDHEHGDWYQGGLDKQPNYKTALKGQIWKGTYHNFRALLNCVEQLNPDTIKPSTPKNLKQVTRGSSSTLTWQPSKDNIRVIGYNIYRNNKKIGFTPLTNFTVDGNVPKARSGITVQAIDLPGNRSGLSNMVN